MTNRTVERPSRPTVTQATGGLSANSASRSSIYGGSRLTRFTELTAQLLDTPAVLAEVPADLCASLPVLIAAHMTHGNRRWKPSSGSGGSLRRLRRTTRHEIACGGALGTIATTKVAPLLVAFTSELVSGAVVAAPRHRRSHRTSQWL